MIPHNLIFGGGVNQTIVNPIVLVLVLILGLVVCFGSRRKALLAFLAGAILIPQDHVLLIGGLHFQMLRVLILFGMGRMLRSMVTGRRISLPGGWNNIDRALVILNVFTAINGVLLWQQGGMAIYQLSGLYNAFGIYFLLRLLIRDRGDAIWAIRGFAMIAVVVAALMGYEQATGKNPLYGSLGGSKANIYGSVMERGGRLRATASFAHPILAGTFGSISLPLFVGLWWQDKKNRRLALLGILASVLIALAANSSTALMGFVAGVVALALWPLRRWMGAVRWGIVGTLLALHLVMKAPVWALIGRIDLAGGSSSYHRYMLVDQCIRHFGDWWMIGTKSYADWGWDMWDLSNQYVATADAAGLIPLLSLVALLVFGFHSLGKARRMAQREHRQELLVWAMSAALFANTVAFFGISYFDQTIVAWYALLAMIPATATYLHAKKAREPRLTEGPVAVESSVAVAALPDRAAPNWFETDKDLEIGLR